MGDVGLSGRYCHRARYWLAKNSLSMQFWCVLLYFRDFLESEILNVMKAPLQNPSQL
jgi:hypothetical protein